MFESFSFAALWIIVFVKENLDRKINLEYEYFVFFEEANICHLNFGKASFSLFCEYESIYI